MKKVKVLILATLLTLGVTTVTPSASAATVDAFGSKGPWCTYPCTDSFY
ncbi:hypothetical protein [Bacillus ndiopicus]|nr:hypothetical protein [Bacillus ndiopicus]